jgi:hypothetical protein
MEVPDFVRTAFDRACRILGVSRPPWHVNIVMSDRPLGRDDAAAAVSVESVYHNVDLEVWTGLTQDQANAKMLHEVMHIQFEHVHRLVMDILRHVSEDQRDIYDQEFRERSEAFIQIVSRSIDHYLGE